MSPIGGSAARAAFLNLDKGEAKAFEVQYNPKEFRVEKSMTWQEAQNPGPSAQPIQYQKGAPMTASFDLIFDTTGDGANVQTTWVEPLLSLTNANVQPAQGEPAEQQKKRPPTLLFQWGSFKMKCVIESVSVSYLMFKSDGTAVRARCTVKLKEWVAADFTGSAPGDTGKDTTRVKLVAVSGGQTVSQVAAANGVSTRALAQANNITDPLADLTGKVLSVPQVEAAAKSAASGAATAALNAVLSGNSSNAGKAAEAAAKKSVTGAASTAAKNALKKLF